VNWHHYYYKVSQTYPTSSGRGRVGTQSIQKLYKLDNDTSISAVHFKLVHV